MAIFHRYSSRIHGNYRKAYLRCGLLTGGVLVLYVVVRLLIGSPVDRPTSLASDGILLVCEWLLMAYYRASLPERKITLKEAMLFGIGLAVVAAMVYGVALWVVGLVSPQQVALITTTMAGREVGVDDPQLHYWAAWWGIYAGVMMMILGGFGAFVGAIFFRNEKAEIKQHK